MLFLSCGCVCVCVADCLPMQTCVERDLCQRNPLPEEICWFLSTAEDASCSFLLCVRVCVCVGYAQ